jgi:Ser/Thr protein kinase RdoA (MazF antagonist)
MSILTKINRPACPGVVRPAGLDFKYPVPGKVSDFIFGVLASRYASADLEPSACRSLAPADEGDPIGHFKAEFTASGREQKLFVRIASPWPPAKSRMMASASVYLASKGIGCEEWLPRTDGKGPFIIDMRTFNAPVQFSAARFMELRMIGCGKRELRELGIQIGRLHRYLRKIPIAGTIKRRSALRSRQLSGVLSRLKRAGDTGSLKDSFPGRAAWMRNNSAFMERLSGDYRPGFRLYRDLRCQPVHGDLNAGNVMYSGRGIVFLDLEEMDHSYLPALADIAMAAERFIVFDEPDGKVLQERMSAFISGYTKEAGSPFSRKGVTPAGQVAAMIRQLDYHAICVLLSMEENERRVFPEEEWDKFVLLESRTLRFEED